MEKEMIALVSALVGFISSGLIAIVRDRFRFADQVRLKKMDQEHDKAMYELKTIREENIKETLRELLNHREYTDRSFGYIKKRLAGYEDDELRKFLHEVEAVPTKREDGSEWWYLKSRTGERVTRRAKRKC